MNKPILQVVNEKEIKRITVRFLSEGEKPKGRNTTFFHPDCEIYLVGRDSHDVAYNIMLALQSCHMPVRSLVRPKTR